MGVELFTQRPGNQERNKEHKLVSSKNNLWPHTQAEVSKDTNTWVGEIYINPEQACPRWESLELSAQSVHGWPLKAPTDHQEFKHRTGSSKNSTAHGVFTFNF